MQEAAMILVIVKDFTGFTAQELVENKVRTITQASVFYYEKNWIFISLLFW